MATDPLAARRAPPRAGMTALAERVARVETRTEHLQETLNRIDASLVKMQQKIDTLADGMSQGLGGLRVGALLGQVAAAIAGFVAAHLWPGGK